MSKTTKLFTNFEILNIIGWANIEDGFWSTTKLPIKLQWDMKKNINVFNEIKTNIEEFQKKIQEKYSDDKHSEEKEQDGQIVRVIKEKYYKEYDKEMTELFLVQNEVEITQFNIEDFGDITIEKNDMDMLAYFISDSDDTEIKKTDGEVI